MKKLLLSLSASLLVLPMSAQLTKVLTAEKFNEYGLVYSLPTTALEITVKARKEVRTPGPYAQYARHYLGKHDVITERTVNWTVTEVSVTPVGVKNNTTQYLMQLKPGATTFIGVDDNGMLLSVNAAPSMRSGQQSPVSMESVMIAEGGKIDEYLTYVDMDFVSAQNSMKQAELLANTLMDVRDAINSLNNGTSDNAPADGRQHELMLNELKAQRDAITRAFEGTVAVEEFSRQYTYIPQDEGEEVLFRISDFSGLVDKDDYSGAPVYIKTEVVQEGTLPVDINGEEKKVPKDAVVYALPGTARISVYTSGAGFFNKEMEFAQFGTTFGLAPTLFTDKKAATYARFSPVTGALLEIGLVSDLEKE